MFNKIKFIKIEFNVEGQIVYKLFLNELYFLRKCYMCSREYTEKQPL